MMKKLIALVFVSSLLGLLAFTQSIEPLAIGSSLPKATVKMLDVSGKKISLNDAMMENGLLVMFSCNTCPYVIKNQERTINLAARLAKNKIGYILINSNEAQRTGEDSYENMKQYAIEQKYNFSYVVDEKSELANSFGATRTPEVFLFNKDKKLVYHGAIDNNPADAANVSRHHVKIAIGEMLNSTPVTEAETKSVGCAIKRNKP